MTDKGFPRIEWALFCERAERDHLGFFTLRGVKTYVPRIREEGGVHALWLALCVCLGESRHAKFRIDFVWPGGRRLTNHVELTSAVMGCTDGAVDLSPMSVPDLGDFRAEFTFDGEMAPSHVAILHVVDAPYALGSPVTPGVLRLH